MLEIDNGHDLIENISTNRLESLIADMRIDMKTDTLKILEFIYKDYDAAKKGKDEAIIRLFEQILTSLNITSKHPKLFMTLFQEIINSPKDPWVADFRLQRTDLIKLF